MPRFKETNPDQTVLLAVSFDRQILPGTFEHTLNYLVDHKRDLSVFHHKYRNEEGGRPAYDPALLFKTSRGSHSGARKRSMVSGNS